MLKSGYKTSEFYATLIATIFSLLTMAGVIEPSRASEMQELVLQAVSGIIALVAVVSYVYSRTQLKVRELETNKKVVIEG